MRTLARCGLALWVVALALGASAGPMRTPVADTRLVVLEASSRAGEASASHESSAVVHPTLVFEQRPTARLDVPLERDALGWAIAGVGALAAPLPGQIVPRDPRIAPFHEATGPPHALVT